MMMEMIWTGTIFLGSMMVGLGALGNTTVLMGDQCGHRSTYH